MICLKKIAEEIYAMPYHLRAKRLAEIPEDTRWIVKTHIDNLARRDQDENRKRNAERAGFSLPRKA